jgi:F0F1-type ATP synthase membrane subunit b/b'
MRFWTAYAFLAFGIATKAWSATGGGHGSPVDLIAPAVNLGILMGVLIWKTKAPLKNYFNKKSEDVANTLERANLKAKEAQIMLDNQKNKMATLDVQIKNIQQHAQNEILNYEKNLSREVEDKISKLKSDASAKIQADKKQLMDELNNELLDQVIKKTKSTVKNNKDYQNKVSAKMLQGLQ